VDDVGNQQQSTQNWTVKVDTTVPDSFNLNLPLDDSWSGSNDITFNWIGSGDSGSGLDKYQLYIDGELKYDNIPYSKTSTTTWVTEGSHNWYIKAVDNAGNQNQSSQNRTIKVDVSPPDNFSLNSPVNNNWMNSDNITFQWNASGDSGSGLSCYRLYMDGELKEDNIPSGQTSTTTFITEGSHGWYVKAVDVIGNQQQSSQNWTVKVDTTPPDSFNLSLPMDTMWLNSNNVTFQWDNSGDNGSGLSKYQLFVDGGLKEDDIFTNQKLSYITEGSHGWYIKAIDNAGNLRQSNQNWTVNVEIIESGEVTSIVLPGIVNQGGHHEAKSANNELVNSLGEMAVCHSTYTSENYYLFSGFIQAIAYPGTITAIAISSSTSESEITLSWTSPGSDGTVGTCAEYDIRYSTQITFSPSTSEGQFQNSISVSAYSPIPSPQSYKTPQNMTITGLISDTTYYFAIKSRDSNYCWSFLSRGATIWMKKDIVAPAQVVDLSASPQLSGDVELSWTAPGDNLWSGKLSTGTYHIDYSTFTKSWSYGDYRVNISTHNVQPYDPQCYIITGLEGGVTYYFRIWTADEKSNWSDISNASTCQVHVFLSVDISSSAYDFGTIALSSASVSLESISVQNKGNASQSYKLLIVSEPNATWQSVTYQAPGAEEYRFSGIFRSSIPAVSDFSIEDAFSVSADRSSSQTNLARDTDPDNEKGFNVPVGTIRKLWFKFEAPVFTEITTVQSVPVRIMAIP
jgi:hypothetical protein